MIGSFYDDMSDTEKRECFIETFAKTLDEDMLATIYKKKLVSDVLDTIMDMINEDKRH